MADLNGVYIADNINYVNEDNWSVLDVDADVWYGSLPYKTGDEFPTAAIKTRASISKTNRLIYCNEPSDIYSSILSVYPEIDPMYGWQIREIIMQLPYFKNATDSWVGLVAGDFPLVDFDNDEISDNISEILDNSNIEEILQTEIRSRFMDVISAYRVDVSADGKPFITPIEAKNLICFVDSKIPTSITVNVVFSIYNTGSEDMVDFVEYHMDGKIVKTTFKYSNGTIGELVEQIEDRAFNGKYNESPIIVFKHNTLANEVYGTDQYRYWYPSMMAAMRELQNVFRLGERTREMIRKVPDSAIRKNEFDGSSVFFNKGTIGYNEGKDKSPDIEYVVPEIRMDEAIKALENAVKQVAIDTKLGVAFFDASSLGSRLSSDSLKALLYQAEVEAKRMTKELRKPFKEMIIKLCKLFDIDIKYSKLTVEFNTGFYENKLELIDQVQKRLESEVPSITLVDAIMKMDKVTSKVARRKAYDILTEREQLLAMFGNTVDDSVNVNDSDEDVLANNNNTADMNPSTGIGITDSSNVGEFRDNTVWENQMYPRPHDMPQGIVKGAKSWGLNMLRRRQ